MIPTPSKECGNKEEHHFHPYDEMVDIDCSGKAECGAWSHTPHKATVLRGFWCEGVCNCGMLSRGPHGPGAHK